MILAQLKQLDKHNNETDNNDPNTDMQHKHEHEFDTTNASINDQKITQNGMELPL